MQQCSSTTAYEVGKAMLNKAVSKQEFIEARISLKIPPLSQIK
jgi:hypothetical protein